MIAVSLDNLFFFLLIAVAALFQLLSKAVGKARKSDSNEKSSSPSPQIRRPIQRAPRETDADRIRKFLEALGQPPSSTPPPPVVPRTDIPPRRLAPVPPPPVLTPVWRLPLERQQKPDVTQTESPPPVPAPPVPTFEVHEALPVELQQPQIIKASVEAYAAPKAFGFAKEADAKTNIHILLASKSGLRKAILLREILGLPRGYQAPDATL
jgi:hypothetical protein